MPDLQKILVLVRSIAWEAADILRSYYRKSSNALDVQYQDSEPVTVADVAINSFLWKELQKALDKEDVAYLSEETYKQQHSQLSHSQWTWIVDPLDGTRDFIEKTGEYAIHIALVKENRPVLGLVAVPEAEKLYYATKGSGTFVETRDGKSVPLKVVSRDRIEDLILVVTRSHRHQKLNYLLQKLPCQKQKTIGSVGCKIAAIVEQQADVYISLSGQSAPKDWDIAAPEIILTEAGGQFTHFDLTPLQYNTGDVNQWGGLLASNGQFQEQLCKQANEILKLWSDS
jgi:3'(2'), 5'-bisphosphate nucleotidase